ncbi:hypothetical protein [Actinoplanes nipponensis]|uniref:hypothetical protein n=1 Tax=Actinoplanes nipponensis TaxID=135950 RepID=UPI0031EEFCF1
MRAPGSEPNEARSYWYCARPGQHRAAADDQPVHVAHPARHEPLEQQVVALSPPA